MLMFGLWVPRDHCLSKVIIYMWIDACGVKLPLWSAINDRQTGDWVLDLPGTQRGPRPAHRRESTAATVQLQSLAAALEVITKPVLCRTRS